MTSSPPRPRAAPDAADMPTPSSARASRPISTSRPTPSHNAGALRLALGGLAAACLAPLWPAVALGQDAGLDMDVGDMDADGMDVGEMDAAEADVPDTPPSGGLTGRYFNNPDFTVFVAERVDPELMFEFTGQGLIPGQDADNLSVRWTGQIVPRYTETYTLHTISDDGVRLWIDGRLVIDNFTNHGATENVGVIALRSGQRHDLRLDYFQGGGPGTIQLLWSSPSQVREHIPADRLEPDSPVNAQRPLVFLVVTDPEAFEGTPDTARVLLYRWGSLVEPLTVNLTLGGDVENGVDCDPIPLVVELPADRAAIAIELVPINDDRREGDETLEIAVAEGQGYTIAPDASATLTLHDDEIPPPTPTFTITGTVARTSTDGAPIVVIGATDAELTDEVRRRVLVEPGLFALSSLPAGDYFVMAWADLDGDGDLDPDEPVARPEGDAAALTLPPDALNVDLIFASPGAPRPRDEGCACHLIPHAPTPSPAAWLLVGAALLVGASRRRQRPTLLAPPPKGGRARRVGLEFQGGLRPVGRRPARGPGRHQGA